MDKKEKHFVLVHGACHGAWCWYKVATTLKSMGHRVTALDLAASGVNPKRVNEVHLMMDYCEPLMGFMGSLPSDERVILVGHSMGGVALSIAMERFPEKVSVAVFATAGMPGPDLSLLTLTEEIARTLGSFMDSTYGFDNGPNNPPTSVTFGPNFLSSNMYQLSPPEDLMLAILSVRPLRVHADLEHLKEVELTEEKYGLVPRVFIKCDLDKAMKETQQWMIEKNEPREVMEISGSDHMVMFSKPKELCSCLQEIAGKYS